MPGAPATCAVCHRQRALGSYDDNGEIFICVECQANAKQFIEIQDAIWREACDTDDLGGGVDRVNETGRPEER